MTDRFAKQFMRAIEASGLPKVTFHGLRHSYATIMRRAGTSLKDVSSLLGHTTISTTANLYANTLEDQKADAADRLDEILCEAEKRHAAASAQDAPWAKCGPILSPQKKKPYNEGFPW